MQVNLLTFTRVYWHLLALIAMASRHTGASGTACARAAAGAIALGSRFCTRRDGGVAERLKAHAWKVCMRETVSRVRIPLPPPLELVIN
jgi:hypothetical protein